MRTVNKHQVKDYIMMLVGALMGALAFDLFFLPNTIAPGGITGVATLLNHLVGVPVGITSIVLNAPLFLLGFRSGGGRFVLRSLVAMLVLSVLIDLLPQMPVTHGDTLLASVYGGLLMGLGLGLVLRAGATTGGTDLLAKIIHNHWSGISVGGVLLGLDCLVVAAAGMVFDPQSALYAAISLIVCSKVIDLVIQGWNTAKQFLIISDHAQTIAARITQEMDRGATLIPATGAYSGEPRGMVFCVINNAEVARLKQLISEVDHRAFLTVSNVHEAMGEGFAGLQKKA